MDVLLSKLDSTPCNEKTTLVFDLYGNSTFCFEQFDGSISMPFKMSGKFHMAGNIVVCPLPVFRQTFENTVALLTRHKSARSVIIPPLPRYLFTGCCRLPDHSTNVRDPGHSTKLLTDTICIRNNLKKLVSELGISCHVLDSCCVTDCPTTANTMTRIEALQRVCAPDGVHFSPIGYDNLVSAITHSPAMAMDTTPMKKTQQGTHYWRGFCSAVGSSTVQKANRGSLRGGKFGRQDRGTRNPRLFHPYRRGK